MSFNARFYNVSADPRALDKGIDPNGGIPVPSIRPTENCDILNPKFELDYVESLTTCNYVVVGAPFNRSYFITDISIDIGKKIVISCAVDVLGTYKNGIQEINANVIRQENLIEPYLPDSEYKIRTGFQNYTELFTGGASSFQGAGASYSYVLSWIGGDYTGQYLLLPINIAPADWQLSWADYYIKEDDNYISVGVIYGFNVAPDYETVYREWNGIYRQL